MERAEFLRKQAERFLLLAKERAGSEGPSGIGQNGE